MSFFQSQSRKSTSSGLEIGFFMQRLLVSLVLRQKK
jgi:hypothetical protein